MNTPDIIATALFLSTATAAGGFAAWNWRASTADSATIRNVLAWSAAQRAGQDAEGDGTPPGDREPTPQTTPTPVVHLATVHQLPTRRAA